MAETVSVLDSPQYVVVSDVLRVFSRPDHLPHEDRGYLVALTAVVFVPGEDQQAVVGQCPADVPGEVFAQPGVASRHAAVVHVVAEVGDHERHGGKLREVAAWEGRERLARRVRDVTEVGPRSVLTSVLACGAGGRSRGRQVLGVTGKGLA